MPRTPQTEDLTARVPHRHACFVRASASNAGVSIKAFLGDLLSKVLDDAEVMLGDWPGEAPLFLREVKERNARLAERADEVIAGIIDGVCEEQTVLDWISAKERNEGLRSSASCENEPAAAPEHAEESGDVRPSTPD